LRYAIISDIHSNLEALQATLKKIEIENVDKILCLGDIVGYGPNPNECLDLVQEHCEIIITGNHDFACIENNELMYFNKYATAAIEWTLTVLSKDRLQYLAELPLDERVDNIYLVHSNAYDPRSWDYILSLDEAIYNFSRFVEKICFIGHSHHPIIYTEYTEDDTLKYDLKTDTTILIENDKRYIINVGSVGQPRDGNPDSAFGIFDTSDLTYELIRVRYNITSTFQKMISAGLPQFLADRLLIGR